MSDTKQPHVPEGMRDALESLRSRIIDLEAIASAAAESLDRIPYLPRLPRHPHPNVKPEWTEEQRRDLGRMQSMVYATADAAQSMLDDFNAILVGIDSDDECGAPGGEHGSENEPASHERGDDLIADTDHTGARQADAAVNRLESAPRAPLPTADEHDDPRLSLGCLVIEFHPIPPEPARPSGVVTQTIEDLATQPFHRVPAEHETSRCTDAEPTVDPADAEAADPEHLDDETHRS